MLDPLILRDYNLDRDTPHTSVFCHAPFTSLNFAQNGDATACCYNRTHVLGTYPAQTLDDMWFGPSADELRRRMQVGDLPDGCEDCWDQFQARNFGGLRARSFDMFAEPTYGEVGRSVPRPKVMEFEISNVCNLECLMCNGDFSSLIRKNREHLPPMANPYDEGFVRQLEPFAPHLTTARFLGGEPFMVALYYQIWDLLARVNPAVSVSITTNGTLLNDRVKQVLESLNVAIVVSIDSLQKENYERIRLNADFDTVMGHVRFFEEYVARRGTSLTFAVCPMQQNWSEMPTFLDVCNARHINLYFNTVWGPEHVALSSLPGHDLDYIVRRWMSHQTTDESDIARRNNARFRGLIQQVVSFRAHGGHSAWDSRASVADAPIEVSVVVPAHNAASTIVGTLRSLALQTFGEWEAIVVDAGSTDETVAIAEEWRTRDSRIRVVRQPAGGESAARNAGIGEARADWLLFLDADGWIAPHHLERMTAELASDRSLDAVHCGSARVSPDGTQVPWGGQPAAGDLFPTLARRPAFPVHACLVRRSLVEEVGLFDTTLKESPDWDLWQRVARAGARFGAVGEVLAYESTHAHSAAHSAEQILSDGLRVLRQGHARDPRVPKPALEHAEGAPPEELDRGQLYLLCSCAGLVIGEGRSALPLLALVQRARCSSLDPQVVARHLFDAALLSGDQDAAAWESIWPAARGPLEEFLPALEAQAGTPDLAHSALCRLKEMILRASTTWGAVIADLERRRPDRLALLDAHGRIDALEAASARQVVDVEAVRRMRQEDNDEWLRRVENMGRAGDRLQADLQSAEAEARRRLEAFEAIETRPWVRLGRRLRVLPPQSAD